MFEHVIEITNGMSSYTYSYGQQEKKEPNTDK